MAIRKVFPFQRTAAALAWMVFVFSPFASGQSFFRAPTVDVFAGYSYLLFDSKPLGFSDRQNLNGWNVELALPHLYKGLGAVGDASGNYNHELSAYHFSVGPQYTFDVWKVSIVAHGMYGKSRDRLGFPGASLIEPSNLAREIALGGAIDVPITGNVSWRALQADYLIDSNFGQTQHNIRAATGILIRFGKH